jgi:hypothetical protein
MADIFSGKYTTNLLFINWIRCKFSISFNCMDFFNRNPSFIIKKIIIITCKSKIYQHARKRDRIKTSDNKTGNPLFFSKIFAAARGVYSGMNCMYEKDE